MNFITAVITVRSGSQRVKNKNLKKFCSKNLLEYKIDVLKKVKSIDNIIINTDSEEAIEISKKHNIVSKEEKLILQAQIVLIVNFGKILLKTLSVNLYFLHIALIH